MTLGDKITMLRKQKSLSQGDLADKISVSRDAIGKYERGNIMPTADKAKKMADVHTNNIYFFILGRFYKT